MNDFMEGVKHAIRFFALICLLPVALVALLFVGISKLWSETQ